MKPHGTPGAKQISKVHQHYQH